MATTTIKVQRLTKNKSVLLMDLKPYECAIVKDSSGNTEDLLVMRTASTVHPEFIHLSGPYAGKPNGAFQGAPSGIKVYPVNVEISVKIVQ